MIQIKNERKSSMQSASLLEISFNLKQCTVYHNKFGCYSFDLKYGNSSKRSPTINILKERVNLDVILSFKDIPADGEDIYISLYNQVLVKNKQNDVLISQQILKLSDFNSNKKQSSTDQFLTFEQDGQLKAQVKYTLQVNDPRGDDLEEGPRRFIDLLKEWMGDQFLKQIITKVEQDEKEERLKKLRQQQEELLKKKREEEEIKRKQKEDEDFEKQRQEKYRKFEEQNKLKKLKEEREQRERDKLRKEEEEREKQRLLKQQQKDDRAKQKRKELEEIEEKRRQKQQAEENDLKQYENEGFEEEQEQKKQQNIKPSDSDNRKDSQKKQKNEEIVEEMIEETEEINNKSLSSAKKTSQHFIRKPTIRQKSQIDGYYHQGAISRESSKEKSFLDRSGVKLRSATKLDKRNFMAYLKQWMSKFLKKIIRQTSFTDKLNLYTSSFYIFGDETFPYIIIFDPVLQQLDRISLPKSLTMYRYSQAVTLPNGKIFICGGVNSKLNNILPLCQLYDPFLHKGYPLPSMHQARYTHSGLYFNDFIYVLGGRTYGSGESSILNSFERFSLKSNRWEKLASLQDGRCTTNLIGLQDKKYIYLIGGFSPKGRLNQLERYNIQDNTWTILNVRLPLSVEAGISFAVQGSSDQFYYMFGRGNEDRNEEIFKIQINPSTPELDRVDRIGRVKKSRVLPSYFIDDQQKLYVFGGDENAWERYELPSFESRFGKKCNVDILPSDMKMFCSAQSYIERPRKPALTGIKDAFYIHIVVFDLDLSVKQFKSGKEQITTKSNKISLTRSISNYSCQLINSNYLLLFGGEYVQNAPQTPVINKEGSKSKLPSKQQQPEAKPQQNKQETKLSKECYIYSLNTQQILQLSPSLQAKKNSSQFFINQMIYSFGGETLSSDGSIQVCKSIERFHLKQNKWERMVDLQYPISLSSVFMYDKTIYLLGGINSDKQFNNLVLKYNAQYDYIISSRHTLPIEFKHTIQFFDSNKQPTQFVLLFSASFKQQGVYNLLSGEFKQIEIVSQQSYINDEKRVLRVAQEKETVSFILPNRIDIFRVDVDLNSSSQDGFPTFQITNIKEIILQGGKQPQSVQKEQVVPIRNIFMTRYVDRRMEFYDFIEFNENRRVLRTSSSSSGQNINSASNLDEVVSNGLQILPQQIPSNDSITCMYEDNEGNIKLVKQELSTGYEEDTILISSSNQNSSKIEKRSALSYIQESQKIILTGGLDGNQSVGNIVEVDLNKRKINKIQEMITPRYNHCQIIVGHYLYMIGGCTIIQSQSTSTNNSPSLQKLQQMTHISKSQSTSQVFDKSIQLSKNKSEQQKTPSTSAANSNRNIQLNNEKYPTKPQKGISASTTNFNKLLNQSLNKNNLGKIISFFNTSLID